MKILFVASTGGHLAQLLALEEWWAVHDRSWVTFKKPDAVSALQGEKVSWAFHPTTRNPWNALRNFGLAIALLAFRRRPDVIVSTGAGVAFPFFLTARLWRIRTVYIEVFDRINSPTLTGLMCYPLTDVFCVQWPEQQRAYPEGVLIGQVM